MSPAPPPIPKEQRRYGRVVYGMAYAACLFCLLGPLLALTAPERSVTHPFRMVESVLAGQDVATVWEEAAGGFPGAHFYRRAWTSGDGLAQFGLAMIGCTASAWALLTATFFLVRRRAWGYACLAVTIAAAVFLSAFL